jgi:hypothetical protein
MDQFEIQNIIEKQKQFFKSGATLDVNFRLDVPLRYPPYKGKQRLIKSFIK